MAWCRPLKTKTAAAVWDAFADIMKESKAKPNSIWVDKGSKLYNSLWTGKLKALKIARYSTFGQYKVSLAERFIRTLKHKLWFTFYVTGKRKWVDLLGEVVAEYNETEHSTIGMTPADAQLKHCQNERAHMAH